MIDLSKIPDRSWLGRVIRSPLRLIPADTVLPILQGPLRGMRWIVGAGNHGCWLGMYERDQVEIFAKLLNTGMVVFDIGAHAGYYSLLAARLTGFTGQIFAFEPLPANQIYLQRHLSLNKFKHVTILPVAVAEYSGQAWFLEGSNRYEGKLSDNGKIGVRTIALDEEIESGYLPIPDLIKIDTEGAEVAILRGAQRILAKHHPILFVSVHSQENLHLCQDLLGGMGYQIGPIHSSQTNSELDFMAVH